jgi:flagellar biosynthesis/type III secretory pathway protein FliH
VSALKSLLEDFEAGGASLGSAGDIHTQQVKAMAYSEGYAAGVAAAEVKEQEGNDFFNMAATRLNDVLADLPNRLNEQLGEALVAVMQKVLPALAAEGFAQETAAAILKQTDLGNPGSVVVKASKDRIEQLTKAFAELGAEQSVTVEVDPALSGSTVTAFWKNAGLEMDIDMAVKESLGRLESFISQFREEKVNE